MIPLSYYLILAAVLFSISLAGLVLNRKSLITLLMCVELLLLAVNTNFIAFADYLASKGEAGARDAGKLRQEGKEYVVQDGDVFHFKFNV